MGDTKAEDLQHQRIVQQIVRHMIKKGCPPESISISGIQNPGLEGWAKRKGIVFGKKQKVDLIFPDGYTMEGGGRRKKASKTNTVKVIRRLGRRLKGKG